MSATDSHQKNCGCGHGLDMLADFRRKEAEKAAQTAAAAAAAPAQRDHDHSHHSNPYHSHGDSCAHEHSVFGSCAHDHQFDGDALAYKRVLWLVIAINAVMFFVEMIGGHAARSQALQADALDFLADSLTYGVSLWAIGRPQALRSKVALLKGLSLFGMGLYVFGRTAYEVLYLGMPRAELMGVIGFAAMIANLASVLLLYRWKDGDANVRSVWLCSRNDAIGNVIVMLAAVAVWGTATGWPDVIVSGIMAGLFLNSAWLILRQSLAEMKQNRLAAA